MFRRLRAWVWNGLTRWLRSEPHGGGEHLSDFERLRFEIRPTDVLLVEGRSRVSYIIKSITLSTWTHSALYIGRLSEIEDPKTRALVEAHYDGPDSEPLVIEAELGEGTIVSPLRRYDRFHVRICRPSGLSHRDAQAVVRYAAHQLGLRYGVRQILDLARFMFPYGLLPRRWRSSLFQHNAGEPTHTVCSSMIASAFHSVHFPILPLLVHDDAGELKMFQRNFKLFTPKDFDYSPYFNIIKYPMLAFDELAVYRNLPWDKNGAMCNDIEDCKGLIAQQSSESRAPVQSINLLAALIQRLAPT
ncbi:MAG: YiiX/YebB-like N1pC/P60 family cysteine hydrolase [Chromatiales bacterium]|jgi:hypothetical protein